jgi:hypothetical protein
MRFNDI